MFIRKAILIIHGFAGGSYDTEDLASYLELNRKFDVFQFTLPGHDRNLSKSRYSDWIEKSEDKINWLINKGYKTIYLVGHSMGGVIATYLAAKYKQVKKLVLATPAFHYMNVTNDKIDIKESIKSIPKLISEYSATSVISKFLKININAIKEFMSLIKKYYDTPKYVTCPVLILRGEKDNIVPKSSCEHVYNQLNNKVKRLVYVSGVTHDIFKSGREEEIFSIIEKFLKTKQSGGIYNI